MTYLNIIKANARIAELEKQLKEKGIAVPDKETQQENKADTTGNSVIDQYLSLPAGTKRINFFRKHKKLINDYISNNK